MQSSDINVTNIKVRQTLTKQNQTSRYKEGGKKRDPGKEEVKYPKTINGQQGTGAGNGKRETESVEWEQQTLNGEQGTMSWERETAKRKREREKLNGEQKTSNREPRTEVWRRVFSGNPPNNSKGRAKEKESEQVLQLQT